MNLNKYILEIIVFFSGAVVMIFELVGSRILGPFLGTSIFVWTSLIGIIMGSLSLGYYFGGRFSDNNPSVRKLSSILFFTAVFIGVTFIFKDIIIISLLKFLTDIKISSIIISILLFFPPSLLLGMVSPYAIKLKLNSLDNSGSTVGTLYAISTFGSIFGTFLSGFFLIPFLGTNNILILLIMVLVVLSLSLSWGQLKKIRFYLFFLFIVIGVFFGMSNILVNAKLVKFDIDTAYNRIFIVDGLRKIDGRSIRQMSINNENSSAMFLDSEELVFDYTKYYHLARHFFPNFKKTLMLGGAGYSFPKNFLLEYPEATIEVVEIDPELTELAKKYFRLKENERLNIVHQDGRVFLNNTKNKYDVIFGDAFSSHYSLPYQLTTKEAIRKEHDILNEGGVVILNIISALEGEKSAFLKAEYKTYKSVFSQVFLFPVRDCYDENLVQNIILVAVKSNKKISLKSDDDVLDRYLDHFWKGKIETDLPILTDDWAPVDYYIGNLIK